MLTSFELKLQLSVILAFLLKGQEQLLDVVLNQEGASQDSHDFIDASVKIKRSFNNCNRTIRDDSHINLYPHSVFCIALERLDTQVSLHPFKEGLDCPSLFIKKGYILGIQVEIVCVVSEGSLTFGIVVNNSPDWKRIVLFVSFRGEPYGLISKYIVCTFKKVFSVHYFIFGPSFFSYDKK